MLPNPWLLLVGLFAFSASVGGAYGYGRHAGAEAERTEWQLAINDQQKMANAQLLKAKDAVIETERRNTAETLRLQSELAAKKKELANERARDRAAVIAAGGLRDPGAVAGRGGGSGGGPAAGGAGSGPAASEAAGILSEEVQGFLWDIVGEADDLNAAYATCLEDLARRAPGTAAP